MYHCNRIIKKMKNRLIVSLFILAMLATSCSKTVGYGDIEVHVDYSANGNPLVTDSLCYVNEAGNRFLVTEIQWFISKITLVSEQGDEYVLGHREVTTLFEIPQEKVFYIDTNLPESQTLIAASLPCQRYVSMHFTFGLDQDDNVTGFFTDPPESNMFWPDPLGGGYHYMKLNGKYLDPNGNLAPMNIHLGIGQNEDHTEFYQNYFTVELPLDLDLEEDATNVIHLNMNIDNWFRNPHTYDITAFGSAIMQNQEAQQILRENGQDVFTINTNDQPMNKIAKTMKGLMKKAAPKPHFYTKEHLEEVITEHFTEKEEEQ